MEFNTFETKKPMMHNADLKNHWVYFSIFTAQKVEFSIKDYFSKLQEFLMEHLFFYAAFIALVSIDLNLVIQ